jgi:hypothetical protein
MGFPCVKNMINAMKMNNVSSVEEMMDYLVFQEDKGMEH